MFNPNSTDPMKNVFIIRHGETDNNKSHIIQGRSIDASINDTGRKQAFAIRDALKDVPVQRLIASGLVRTHETAQPLAEVKELEIEKFDELDEINFGVLEGLSFLDNKDLINELNDKWKSGQVDHGPENGESPLQTYERANRKVTEILENSEEENLVFIVHGRLTRILLSEWLGLGLKNMHQIEHQNGSINHLTWHQGKFEAVDLNRTDHLMEWA